jgi:DNA modification methylase
MSDFTERLIAKRKARAELKERYGFVPLSVLHNISRGRLHNSIFSFQRENPDRAHVTKSKFDTENRAEWRKLGAFPGARSECEDRPSASTMPAELVDFFVRYYAEPGQVYLDPFMGQGVQMQVAKLRGLHYHGYDLCREFFDYIEAVRSKIDDGKTEIRIFCADSTHPDEIPDGVGDFSFHSPPYWNIEYYGDDPAQLGNNTYDGFLSAMVDVYQAWLPKFKPGAWHVVNVNDFRRKGAFYTYHADTITALREAGWIVHDLWVVEGIIGGLSRAFAVQKHEQKLSPKVHEYAIVAKAPE